MRIQGITVPDEKRLEVSLTSIYGIGRETAKSILDDLGISYNSTAKDLTEDQEKQIREKIEERTIEGDLKREKSGNIQRLKDIKSYRGSRHTGGYPVRGQRTKTNSRTVRPYQGKKTMGSGRRKLEKK